MTNITITYDTPPEKVERAVQIIKEVLDHHEGMSPDFPPRVFSSEFNKESSSPSRRKPCILQAMQADR